MQKTVSINRLTTIAMVSGGEKKHPVVIHDGVVKRWVGIGWISEGKAKTGDYKSYPVAVEPCVACESKKKGNKR